MCGQERTVTDVAVDSVCSEAYCFVQDLIRMGCDCHNRNYDCRVFYAGIVLVGANRSPVECQHYACHRCSYALNGNYATFLKSMDHTILFYMCCRMYKLTFFK